MKAICVFLIGVAVGWMLTPRLEPEPIVELEPILPEPEYLELAPLVWIDRSGRVTWTRPH